MLCFTCAGIFSGTRPSLYAPPDIVDTTDWADLKTSNERDSETLRDLHSDVFQVAQGATQGCSICDIVWRHFFRNKTAQEYLEEPYIIKNGRIHLYTGAGTHYRIMKPQTSHRNDYGPNALELQIAVNAAVDKGISEYKDVALEPIEDEPAVDPANLPRPDSSIYAPNTFRTIDKWLASCKQNHSRCNVESKQPPWYPTRLLDLKYCASTNLDEQVAALVHLFSTGHLPADCKLIKTATTSVTGPYMTLSHRWGKPCITTKSNIRQRMQRIPADELPKTFSDAINFTRCLGVRYLWIDSLCIIQGTSDEDADDWKREAVTMNRIYAHSMLNLEASVGHSSLLQPRNPRLIAPCIVSSRWKGMKSVNYVVTDFRYWDSRVHRSVCNARAWITQERWLAPRVLHFAFDQLLWECRELEAGETYPHGLTKEVKSQSSIGFKAFSPKIRSDNRAPSEYESRIADWHDILLTYGRSELTYENDRLIAIAGLAAKFSEILNDDWVAGLWRRILPGELLWRVDKTKRSNKPPELPNPSEQAMSKTRGVKSMQQVNLAERLKGPRYQAPSWSWASVLGDIVPGYFTEDGSEDSMIDILDVELKLLDPAVPLGRLVGGKLKLKGTLYPMAIDPPNWTQESAKRERMPIPPTVYLAGLPKQELSGPLAQWLRESATRLNLPIPEMHTHIAHLQADEPTDYLDLANSYFLPVRKHVYDMPGNKYHGMHLVNGLALMPTGKRGEYTRLGVMNFGEGKCKLFEDGFEVQKSGEEASGMKAHPLTLKEALYIEGHLGVLTIV